MKSIERLDKKFIEEALRYADGKIYWRDDRPASHFHNDIVYKQWVSRYAGKEAGTTNVNGYSAMRLSNQLILRCWVVWLLNTGDYPTASIRRIDGDKMNDEFSNLRLGKSKA